MPKRLTVRRRAPRKGKDRQGQPKPRGVRQYCAVIPEANNKTIRRLRGAARARAEARFDGPGRKPEGLTAHSAAAESRPGAAAAPRRSKHARNIAKDTGQSKGMARREEIIQKKFDARPR